MSQFPQNIFTPRSLSAIALMGLSLIALDMPPFLSRVGGYLMLSAGSAAAAVSIQKNDQKSSSGNRQQPLLDQLYESVLAEDSLHSQLSQTAQGDQAKLANAQARIQELESKLAQKTELATQMLTELETEATETFHQFTAKISTQEAIIQSLSQQLEALQQKNLDLLAQQHAILSPPQNSSQSPDLSTIQNSPSKETPIHSFLETSLLGAFKKS